MDYKALLIKYMAHVECCEGTMFTAQLEQQREDVRAQEEPLRRYVPMSEDEIAAILACEDEADDLVGSV